jgi:hypothetical protein
MYSVRRRRQGCPRARPSRIFPPTVQVTQIHFIVLQVRSRLWPYKDTLDDKLPPAGQDTKSACLSPKHAHQSSSPSTRNSRIGPSICQKPRWFARSLPFRAQKLRIANKKPARKPPTLGTPCDSAARPLLTSGLKSAASTFLLAVQHFRDRACDRGLLS